MCLFAEESLRFWATVEFKIIWEDKYDSYKGNTAFPIYPLPLFLSSGLPCENASHRQPWGHFSPPVISRTPQLKLTGRSIILMNNINLGPSQARDGRRCGESQHNWDFYWIRRLLARPCCFESKQHLSACRGNGAVRPLFRTKKRPECITPRTMGYS